MFWSRRVVTFVATTSPFWFFHGPGPMRSFAFVPVTLRKAAHLWSPACTAVARSWHFLSAPSRPPRLPPVPAGVLVTKNVSADFGGGPESTGSVEPLEEEEEEEPDDEPPPS